MGQLAQDFVDTDIFLASAVSETTTTRLSPARVFGDVFKGWTLAGSSAWLLATLGALRGGEGSGCVLSGVTSSRPSQWHWRWPLTTALHEVSGATCTKPHGDRGPPVQRPRTMLCGARRRVWPVIPSSSRCTRKNSGGTRPDRLYEVRPQERRQHALRADAGRSCAADGKPAGGGVLAARFPHSRAGYRSAQNLIILPSFSQAPCAFRGADGGTVGGSADDRIQLYVARACGAERGHSSSSWS